MDISKFELHTFFREDAERIFSARQRGIAIHRAKNIDAAGDEIELPVRDVIKRRLPRQYYIGQGHIVDHNLSTSGQFDIIISDNNGSPILFSSENQTDYLTFESIYAIGEIKSTYYNSKNYISEFEKKVARVNDHLHREATSPNQITQGFRVEEDSGLFLKNMTDWAYKNPVFKFMVFADSGDADISKICQQLDSFENKKVPNLLVFLNKGIIVKAKVTETSDPENKHRIDRWELWPEFIAETERDSYKSVWIEFEENSASSLAYLVYALNTHIQASLVLRPNLMHYHSGLFKVSRASIWIDD